MKKNLLIFALAIGVPIFLILCAEGALRLFIHFRYGVPGKSYGIYQADPELGAVHRANSYNNNSVINNWGLRNVEDVSERKPAGALRVYCSGGSTTFCYNLSTQQSWPHKLQAKLREIPGRERDEVLNGGEICFAVSQEFALARRLVPRLKPDVVLLFTGVNEDLAARVLTNVERNDLDRFLREKRWGVFPTRIDQARFLKRNSALVRVLEYKVLTKIQLARAALVRNPGPSAGFPVIHPWVLENFDRTLNAYLDYLRANGCRVILIRYGDSGIEDPYLEHVVRMFRDRAVAIARERGEEVCDVASIVERHPQRKELFISTGVHVTNEGAELLADELLKCLGILPEGL